MQGFEDLDLNPVKRTYKGFKVYLMASDAARILSQDFGCSWKRAQKRESRSVDLAIDLVLRPTPAGTLLDHDHRRHVHPVDRKGGAR